MEYIFFARFNFVFYIPAHYFNLRAGGRGGQGTGIKGAGWGRGGGAV